MARPIAIPPSGPHRRLDSWKEIAAFFGRDERTVKRWEKERGLPVHRLPGERGGVFAWSQELTAWLNSAVAIGKAIGELAPLPPIVETPESQPTEPPAIPVVPAVSPPRLRRTWIWV